MPPTPVCLLISGLGGSSPSRTPRGAHPLRPCAASRCRLGWHRALRRYISTSTSIDSTASIEGRTPVIFPALRRSSSSRISSSLTRCGMGVGSVTAWGPYVSTNTMWSTRPLRCATSATRQVIDNRHRSSSRNGGRCGPLRDVPERLLHGVCDQSCSRLRTYLKHLRSSMQALRNGNHRPWS